MDLMKEILKKKKSEDMDPMYKDAKMGILKEIRDLAAKDMGEDLKGLKKVTVAAPDQEGLKAGLNKAEELIEGEPCPKCGKSPCECEKDMEEKKPTEDSLPEMSAEEIDALLKLLEAKKAKLQSV
jgi:hypothetical protein